MLKYEQLKAHMAKHKYWHRYYNLKENQNRSRKCIDFENYGTYTQMHIYENDDFLIKDIKFLITNNGTKCAILCAMPFPVVVEKTRAGYTVNGYKWHTDESHPLMFNKDGDCLNPPVTVKDNNTKRKHFNKFMLNWQKQMCAIVRINPPPLKIVKTLTQYHELFLEAPTIDNYNRHIKPNYYGQYIQIDHIKVIKNFRKRYQDKLYASWLEDNEPVIDTWIKENIKCEESSQS